MFYPILLIIIAVLHTPLYSLDTASETEPFDLLARSLTDQRVYMSDWMEPMWHLFTGLLNPEMPLPTHEEMEAITPLAKALLGLSDWKDFQDMDVLEKSDPIPNKGWIADLLMQKMDYIRSVTCVYLHEHWKDVPTGKFTMRAYDSPYKETAVCLSSNFNRVKDNNFNWYTCDLGRSFREIKSSQEVVPWDVSLFFFWASIFTETLSQFRLYHVFMDQHPEVMSLPQTEFDAIYRAQKHPQGYETPLCQERISVLEYIASFHNKVIFVPGIPLPRGFTD